MIEEDSVRFAHSGPSHCHQRHRCAITCCQRAPPATRVEATEKLYERHCLVIKIVSSFFASLTKFSYL